MITIFFLLNTVFAGNINDRLPVETILPNAPAQNNGACTLWTLDKSTSCSLKSGDSSKVWRRECEHVWDNETMCWPTSPNDLQMVCTDWVENDSVECVSGEAQWFRDCQDIRYKKTTCSNSNPNNN